MSFWSDMDYEVHPVELDMNTADRLLAGAVADIQGRCAASTRGPVEANPRRHP